MHLGNPQGSPDHPLRIVSVNQSCYARSLDKGSGGKKVKGKVEVCRGAVSGPCGGGAGTGMICGKRKRCPRAFTPVTLCTSLTLEHKQRIKFRQNETDSSEHVGIGCLSDVGLKLMSALLRA